MKQCDLCSKPAERDRVLCDDCAQAVQRLLNLGYLAMVAEQHDKQQAAMATAGK